MFRAAIIFLALSAAPAFASGHYQAEPVRAPMEDRIVAKNAVWTRSGAAYQAPKSDSRPASVCGAFARKVGPLKSFSIGGTPVGAADLEKCNGRVG